jgi:hypothetical protein
VTDQPIFEPGDVVYGADPFKGATAARPWLVVSNHDGRPFHGEQSLAVTLTTKTWMDGLIEVEDEDWIHGGTPEPSRVVPWGVQSISSADIDTWQGRIRDGLFQDVVDAVVAEVRG